MSREAQFTAELTKALTTQIQRHPERYVLGDKTVEFFVQRDVADLKETGSCPSFGPAHRIAARACGIGATPNAIKKYLQGY